MYTDPTLQLYRALGLTRQTADAGKDEDKGDYLVQSGVEQTVFTLKRAAKMPLFHNPGHFFQLGGEFVFDSPLSVSYTHRMVNTRNHAPIRDICEKAGVFLKFIHYEPGPSPPPVHRLSDMMDEVREEEQAESEQRAEEDALVAEFPLGSFTESRRGSAATGAEGSEWEDERDADLDRIRQKRNQRRRGTVPSVEEEVAPEQEAQVGLGISA